MLCRDVQGKEWAMTPCLLSQTRELRLSSVMLPDNCMVQAQPYKHWGGDAGTALGAMPGVGEQWS